jgi:predicted metal-dependent hydrolase
MHELCHVISQKHDELFYKELTSRLPDWKNIKERLEIRHG